MRNRVLSDCYGYHRLAGCFRSFADRLAHLIGFAESDTYTALHVTSHDEGAEAETTTSFDNLGASVDEDNLLDGILWGVINRFVTAWSAFGAFIIHKILELKSSVAGCVSQCLDLAVVHKTTTIKNHLGNVFCKTTLGYELPDLEGGRNIGAA